MYVHGIICMYTEYVCTRNNMYVHGIICMYTEYVCTRNNMYAREDSSVQGVVVFT